MRWISAASHRVLDYLMVAAFASAPALIGLTGAPAALAYILAALHLVLTLITRPGGVGGGVVPHRVHGGIEVTIAIVLIVLPFVVGWEGVARAFYTVAGFVILGIWGMTGYATREGHVTQVG